MIAVRKTQASGYHAAAMRAVFAACKARGIDDDMRRDIVRQVTGHASLKDCSSAEIGKVLDRLNRNQKSEYRNQANPRPTATPFVKGGKAATILPTSAIWSDGLPEAANRSADEWRFVFRAAASRQPSLKKIYRLAETLGKMQSPPVKAMPKHYIEGIASQMGGIKGYDNVQLRLEFCDEAALIKIIAALDTHIRRQTKGEMKC